MLVISQTPVIILPTFRHAEDQDV